MVSEVKKKLVQEITKKIKEYPVVGLVNMENLPAKQLQIMRAILGKKNILIDMARKKLLQLALKESKQENMDQLTEKIKGMPALLFSKENPFTLYSILQKNKSPAPAKANQEAPKDIVVSAGPTTFAPGPIISELAEVGIKTKVDNGKLAIIDDTTVAKEGDLISTKLAGILTRLNIQPMEIGLNIVAVWEGGSIFTPKHLHIDKEEYLNNITQAAQWAFNLSVESAYPTKDNIGPLLQKVFQESKSLSLEHNILTDLTAEEILEKIEREAISLKETANVEVTEKPKEKPAEEKPEEKEQPKAEEPVEEPKVEEKPQEEPAEEKPAEEKEEPKEEKQEEKTEEQPEEAETPAEEEKPAEEKPAEEPKVEEKPQEEPVEEPVEEEPVEEKKEQPEEAPAEEKPEEKPAEKEEPKEAIPSAEEMIKATQEKFAPKEEPKEERKEEPQEVPSAADLIAEEKETAEKEKPSQEIEEAEQLFDKLKKEGTLRKEN
ncbi:50S ribosomal protein L10 [Candidatus Woesearchaeota archaeon]|jgi:large subunit ribosomal protein L10|nr:50S ribosomal protein L10 [Candidatus Woesearchaeota archaeon]